MEALYGLRQALVVADESAKASCPCEASFDDPASGKEYEASLCLGQLDHLEFDAVLGGGVLDGLGEQADLSAILLAGRGDGGG